MNERVAELWDAALTGDKYHQTQGALHRKEGGYCCLGVLCDLYGLDTGKGSWRLYGNAGDESEDQNAEKYYFVADGGHESDSFLPPEVIEWAGLDEEDPTVEIEDDDLEKDRTLSSLNDSGFTFKQIAALVRKQL